MRSRLQLRSLEHDCKEKVRPGTGREAGLGHAGGTSSWKSESRTMQEQLSRATQGAVADDCKEAGGRAMPGAIAEGSSTQHMRANQYDAFCGHLEARCIRGMVLTDDRVVRNHTALVDDGSRDAAVPANFALG